MGGRTVPGLSHALHVDVDERAQRWHQLPDVHPGARYGLRADGRSLLPFCPFFRGYVAKHPEYDDVVDG